VIITIILILSFVEKWKSYIMDAVNKNVESYLYRFWAATGQDGWKEYTENKP
jgi:hypothetical protein